MKKFKKVLFGLTLTLGVGLAFSVVGNNDASIAKAGYYDENDTYYHVTSESDFRDNFWNYSNLMFEDNLDFTDSFWCNTWKWINLNNKQWNMSNNQLILEGSEWGTAAILFGGVAYANFRIVNNATSPTLDNLGYPTWFNWVYFSVENSTLTLNGNPFNGSSQIHVDGTSTLNANSLNLDGLSKTSLPEGIPSSYGDANGKALIPIVAEEGATINIKGNDFATYTVGTTTYYIVRTLSTEINVAGDIDSITFDRSADNNYVVSATANGTSPNVNFEIKNLKKDDVDVDLTAYSNFVTLDTQSDTSTKINAAPFNNYKTLKFDLEITAADGSSIQKIIPVTITDSQSSTLVSSIVINNGDSVEILKGDSFVLDISILPEDATNKNYTISSDSNCVSIDRNTLTVTGDDFGTAVITVTASDDSMATDSITVNVTKGDMADGTYYWDDYGHKFFACGSDATLRRAATDNDIFYIGIVDDITLESDLAFVGGKYIIMNHKGVNKTLSLNNCTLSYSGNIYFEYGTIADGILSISGCNQAVTSFTGVFFWNTYVSLVDSKMKLSASVVDGYSQFGLDATSSLEIVSGSNLNGVDPINCPEGIPSIYQDENGQVVCPIVAASGATIVADAGTFVKVSVGGYDYYLISDVNYVPVQSIEIANGDSATIEIDQRLTLNIRVNPLDATDGTYTITSDNTDVVTVDGNNVVGVSEGSAVITVRSNENNQIFDTITITVRGNHQDSSITSSEISETSSSQQDEPSKGGCGGSIAAVSALTSVVALLGVGFISLKKKKETK